MINLPTLIANIESGDLCGGELDCAIDNAMTLLIATGQGYWETAEGQRLRPLWDDWAAVQEAEVETKVSDLNRRILANDWEGWPAPKPFRMPNGMMSDDPFALGDPFAE